MKNQLSSEVLKGIRFTFIRADIKNQKNIPIGCIAYRSNLETGNFEFEISAHNPKDGFHRGLARQIAAGRMLKHPRTMAFDKANPPVLPQLLQEAVQSLLDQPALSPDRVLPESLRKAFEAYVLRQKSLTKITEPTSD